MMTLPGRCRTRPFRGILDTPAEPATASGQREEAMINFGFFGFVFR